MAVQIIQGHPIFVKYKHGFVFGKLVQVVIDAACLSAGLGHQSQQFLLEPVACKDNLPSEKVGNGSERRLDRFQMLVAKGAAVGAFSPSVYLSKRAFKA